MLVTADSANATPCVDGVLAVIGGHFTEKSDSHVLLYKTVLYKHAQAFHTRPGLDGNAFSPALGRRLFTIDTTAGE